MTAYVIAAFAAALTALAFGHHHTLLEHLVSTSARILFALHTAAGLFLAYCAVVSLTHHARGYALALGICAFLELVVASLRQLAVTEANEEAALLEAELVAARRETADLTDEERKMLDYALNLTQLRLWLRGDYTEEEQTALVSLRRLSWPDLVRKADEAQGGAR